jgi:hypothetical protein
MGDVHGGHSSCGSVTGASPFLTGLVTCFATRDGIPARSHVCRGQGSFSKRMIAPVQAGRHQARPPGPRKHLLSLPWRRRRSRDRMNVAAIRIMPGDAC